MLRYLLRAAALAGLFALPSVVSPASAQWTGELSSTLLKPLSPQPAFDVVIYDDTEQNLAFRRAFMDALSRAGYQTGDDATYVFSFATSVTWQQQASARNPVRPRPAVSGRARRSHRPLGTPARI